MQEKLELRINKLALKYQLLSEKREKIEKIYENDDLYPIFLNTIFQMLKDEPTFFFLNKDSLITISSIIQNRRFLPESRSLSSLTNEIILSIKQLSPDSFSLKGINSYLKEQLYSRFQSNTPYYYNRFLYIDKKVSTVKNGLTLFDLQMFDYVFYFYSQRGDFSKVFELEKYLYFSFISSVNYLSSYIPEIFTPVVAEQTSSVLDQIEAVDKRYKGYVKKARRKLMDK